MTLLIIYVAVALFFSFLCSVMEAVLLSITPSYVGMLEEQGSKHAKPLRVLKQDVDRPLAAILSLNTIAHTVGATMAGAQAVEVFGEKWVGVISAVLTLLILVASEIIPKTLGAVYWRQLVGPVVGTLRPTMFAMWPLVQVSNVLTRWLARGHVVTGVSREEIRALADMGTKDGALEIEESRILKSLLRFRSLRVRDVMTPRTVMFTLPRNDTVGGAIATPPMMRFSRIPLHRERPDQVTTYVLKDEILLRAARGETESTLVALERPLMVVPEVIALPVVLEQLLARREHIALVAGEFGGTEGLVTLEDVIETLLDLEIVDEADSVADMQALARRQWLTRAKALGIVVDEADLQSSDQPTPQAKP